MLNIIGKPLLDLLFPIFCLGCTEPKRYLCDSCMDNLVAPHQQCIVCKKPSDNGNTHAECRLADTPVQLISAFDYHHDLISGAIITGKYQFVPDIFRELASYAIHTDAVTLQLGLTKNTIVVPLPLSSGRLRWRGFNQAEIMSHFIARRFNLVVDQAIIRNRNTKTQKELGKEERLENMRNSFTVSHTGGIRGESFLIVDDVVTTGSTLLEASKILLKYGAKEVRCFTVARD